LTALTTNSSFQIHWVCLDRNAIVKARLAISWLRY